MAIRYKCPSCGHRGAAPNEMGGQKTVCSLCGQKLKLPEAKPLPDAAASASPEHSPTAEYPGTPKTPPATEQQVPPRYLCAHCAGEFALADVYDQDGVLICKACFDRQQAGVAAEPEPPVPADIEHADLPTEDADVPVSDSEPLQTPTCPSCGVPIEPDQTLCDQCAMSEATAESPPPETISSIPRPFVAKRQNSPNLVWIVGGALGAVVLTIFGIIALSGPGRHTIAADNTQEMKLAAVKPVTTGPATTQEPTPAIPDWLTDHQNELTMLHDQAAQQETAGQFDAAVASYEKFLNLARSAPQLNDPIKTQVASAEASITQLRVKMAAATQPTQSGVSANEMASKTGVTTPSSQPTVPIAQPVAAQAGNWEIEHGGQLKAILQKAGTLLAANDKFKAAVTFQQAFELLGSHRDEVHDPELKKLLADALVTRRNLLVQVRSSNDSLETTAGTLLARGLAALNQRRWKAGLECLIDVRDLFDRNVKIVQRNRNSDYILALHGMAIAYLSTQQTPKAGELFDDTAPLGSAVDRELTRELVINRAVTDIIQKTKAMRAAKSIKAFLEKHPSDTPDEDLLNLLGTSLFIAEQRTANKTFLNQCAALYAGLNTKLEATRPSEKRYGITWYSKAEADQKFEARQKKIDEYQKLVGQTTVSFNYWKRQEQLYAPHGPSGVRETTYGNVQAAENNYNNFARAAAAAKKNVPDLEWLTNMEPVLPPLPRDLVQVATADAAGGGSAASFRIQVFAPTAPAEANPPAPASTDPSPAAPPPDPAPAATAAPAEPISIKTLSVPVTRNALAFAIDFNHLITSADVVANATEVRLDNATQDDDHTARVIAKEGNLALLELNDHARLAFLNLAASFTGGAVRCAAMTDAGLFGSEVKLLAGQAATPPQQADWFVTLESHPRLPGSPLLDAQGQIIGVVVAGRDELKTHLACASLSVLHAFLESHSALPAQPSPNPNPMGVYQVTVTEK